MGPGELLDPLRARALELARDRPPVPKAIQQVAAETSAEAAGWAFAQWELRGRAAAKFSRAGQMLFTREGLEMASAEPVAAFHAGLFSGSVLDAGCGIGGDLAAFALAHPGSEGLDLSPEAVLCAAHNLAAAGASGSASLGDALHRDWAGKRVWIDPARRAGRTRTLDPSEFTPPLDLVLAKAADAKEAWVKLSPMLPDEALEKAGFGLGFLSHRRECVEALVQAAEGPRERWAARAEGGGRIMAGHAPTRAAEPLDWVHEADPAAIRAHALGWFGMEALGEVAGWLASRQLVQSPWLAAYKVLWSGAYRPKQVLGAAKELSLAVEVVKTRGVKADPEMVRRELRRLEGAPGVLMLYREGLAVRAVLAERNPAPSAP